METFFRDRSAISILNWAGYSASSGVTDSLLQLLPNPTSTPTSTRTPILYVKLYMAPGAFLAVQFLQSSSSVSIKSSEPSLPSVPGKLSEIHAHKSLLTLYMSEVDAQVLVLSSSEVEGDTIVGTTEQEDSLPRSHKMRVKSFKVSAEVKCPVVQTNLSALVEPGASTCYLSRLVPGQQQLDFILTTPNTTGDSGLVVCDLLEAGIKEASMSFAAHIFRSETRQVPLLTWDSLESQRETAMTLQGSDSTKSQDIKNNNVHVGINIPLVWCQLASPPCGLPEPSAGGLDILLLHDATKAWQDPLHHLKHSVLSLMNSKAKRDKEVMLTLLTNAVQSSSLLEKPFNPLLAKLSIDYRNTVVFACLYQTWRALPMFSEIYVPTSSSSPEDMRTTDIQLVALMLALASRIDSMQGANIMIEETAFTRPSSPAVASKEGDQSSLGYISISPSPSDMALPNRLYANKQYFEQETDLTMFSRVDYTTLAELREALIPFFSAVGVTLEHQLQVPQFNTAQVVVDFTLQLREATLFVLDHVQAPGLGPDSDAPRPLHSYSTTPTLLAEQLLINGCIKHNLEQETSNLQQKKVSLLLPASNDSEHSSSQAKVGIVSNCCVSMETIHVVVTAPLLKLAKHVSVTGKLRRKALKQAQFDAVDEMETPRPPSSPPDPVTESSGAGGHVAKFATSIVTHLASLQIPSITVDRGSFSHIRLLDYIDSPRPTTKAKVASPHLAMENGAKTSYGHLSIPTRSPPVMENKSDRMETLSSSSEHDVPQPVVITMEDAPGGSSPEDVISTMDTCADDTTDSQHVVSSDNEGMTSSFTSSTRKSDLQSSELLSPLTSECSDHTQSLLKRLSIPESELKFSVFGLLKLHTVKCELQVESTRTTLELVGISAAVDTRNSAPLSPIITALPLISELLPTYLSIAATLKKTMVRVNDRGLPESDLLQLAVLPMYASIAISNCPPVSPHYRCLLKLTSLQVDIKQSAVKVHKRFQQLMPAFTKIYHDIFGDRVAVVPETAFSTPTSSAQQVLSVENVMKLPSKLPQGFIHFSLDKTMVYVAPLPSLSITYTVSSPPVPIIC